MEKQIDFYFDLVSPYSYIASMLIDDVAHRGNAKVSWKPFLLGGVLKQWAPLIPRDSIL
ncbi:MAG: hypothetical protein CM1200mP30_29950 [Pseudomonadota bacterium]|nr:MAG: hypothetical protein CM1200mP30_29950 [Pseudomonadota bacterium]